MEDIDFSITNDSQAVEYDEVVKMSKLLIDADFLCFFKNGTRPFCCSALHEKAEVMYDMLHDIAYYTPDKKYVLLKSNIGGYGTYAIENLLYEEEWEQDVEAIEY